MQVMNIFNKISRKAMGTEKRGDGTVGKALDVLK